MTVLACAILGFGMAARSHLRAYERRVDVSVVAIADPSAESRAAARAAAPDAVVAADLDALPDGLEIDVVDVCCPPRWHADATADALARGLHVLCEKPLLVSLEEAGQIRAAVAAARGVLYPSHNYKFAPAVQRMRAAVLDDELGMIEQARFRTLRTSHAAGIEGWRPDWRRDAGIAAGGILQDHGTHAAYLAGHVLGDRAQWVECTTRQGCTGETEDAANLRIGLAGGLRVDVEMSWCARARHTSYELRGTDGTVFFDADRFVRRTHAGAFEMASHFTKAEYHVWFSALFDDFLDLVAQPQRQDALLEEAETAAAVVSAAYRSAERDGERIGLDDLLAE